MQGRSMLPLVRGESTEWRQEFFYEHLFDHSGLPKSEAVRTSDWKYMRYVETEPLHEELYDLARDPNETNDLAGEAGYASVLDEMREKHVRLRSAAR
jgi:arylsulfatase A-like enzyme